jgi:hypothetical protein
MLPPKVIPGERILRVFNCHGCQTCTVTEGDGTVHKFPHTLSVEDITSDEQETYAAGTAKIKLEMQQ